MNRYFKFIGPGALGVLLIASACGGDTRATGSEQGSCYPNGTCNAGLSCLSHLCVSANGLDGGSSSHGNSGGATGSGGTDPGQARAGNPGAGGTSGTGARGSSGGASGQSAKERRELLPGDSRSFDDRSQRAPVELAMHGDGQWSATRTLEAHVTSTLARLHVAEAS